MLNNVLEIKNLKRREFQVLFLRNDDSQAVEIHDMRRVDFSTVQHHLDAGESIFITSKKSQKVEPPCKKPKKHENSTGNRVLS